MCNQNLIDEIKEVATKQAQNATQLLDSLKRGKDVDKLDLRIVEDQKVMSKYKCTIEVLQCHIRENLTIADVINEVYEQFFNEYK